MATLTSGHSQIKASHWYDRQGQAAHRQPLARGDGDRPTTIRDAMKLGLIPSVTNILGILDKPGLIKWKIDQVLRAADANQRQEQEGLDYWMKRVQDAAFQQVEDAADLGTRIHAALDAAFDGQPVEPELQPYVLPVLEWAADRGIRSVARERRIVSLSEGYAGTADFLFEWGEGGIGILDFKTKKTKPGEKVDSYLEHKAQLSAYAGGFWGPDRLDEVLAANVFISSTEPGRIEIVKHTTVREHYDLFLHLCAVWRVVKGYDPREAAA